MLSTKHSLPCLAYTRREANYPKPGQLPIFQRCSDLAPFPGQATSYPPGSPGSGPTAIYLGGPNPQTQPLSNSGTVLLETARNGYAPITYSLTREEHAPNTAPPAPTATDTGVWPQPEPQLIQLKLSY